MYVPLMAGIVGVVSVGSQSSSIAEGIGDAATNWTKALAMRPTRRVRTEGMAYGDLRSKLRLWKSWMVEVLDAEVISDRG
jgi:hypothetical protein